MNDTGKLLILTVAVALLGALLLAVWLIGADRLYVLALILGGALALAIVLGAAALPIRAYKRRDNTGEVHHYHDGTKTIVRERILDGQAPEVKLLQLPAQPQGGAFPELLRAAYQAGALTDRRNVGDPWQDRELREIDLDPDREGWEGDIKA